MYATQAAWLESPAYRAAVAAERAYWSRVGRGEAEPARVRSSVERYAPEVEKLAPAWGRLGWQKIAAEIESRQGNAVPGLPFDCADQQIRDEARAAAASIFGRAMQSAKTLEGVRAAGAAACAEWGIAPPDAGLPDKGAIARLFCSEWWVRRLRASHGRRVEGAAQRGGYVHKGAGCYASAVAVARRQDQRARNRRALESVTLENQHGDEFTLAELADRSNANPEIRRGELMTRIAGFEVIAQGLGHAAEFWTLTAPSRFHAVTIDGRRNDKHDGSTPRDAQAWLCEAWARWRAWAARAGVRYYGFRIAEPHHDGCPHWHLLLWMETADVKRARAKLVRYGMGNADHIEAPPTAAELEREYRARGFRPTTARWIARDEAAALAAAYLDAIKAALRADKARRQNGFKFVSIDPARGTAAGYVAKYVAKNIDGFRLGKDLYGNDEVEASERVEAWAATWGIRQFQQLGGAPVGVWRELRRIAEGEAMTEEILLARKAADVGAWDAYLVLMGGPMAKRAAMPLAVARTPEGEKWGAVERMRGQDEGEGGERVPYLNRYGEPCGRSVFGVRDVARDAVTVSRRFRWEMKGGGNVRVVAFGAAGADVSGRRSVVAGRAGAEVGGGEGEARSAAASSGVRGSGLGRAVRAPWTRVNNCTGGNDGSQGVAGLGGDRFDDHGGVRVRPGRGVSRFDRGIGDGTSSDGGSGGGGGRRAGASGGGGDARHGANDGRPGIVGVVSGVGGDHAGAVRD